MFGFLVEEAQGHVHETCGSPGETANDPTKGHHYDMSLADRFLDMTTKSEPFRNYDRVNGKSTVHNSIALHAPDQLRQRMAWALAQIFVVGEEVNLKKEVETWATFYDIFVRHAFGNYRAILREVIFVTDLSPCAD